MTATTVSQLTPATKTGTFPLAAAGATTTTARTHAAAGRSWQTRLLAAAVPAGANVLVYTLARALGISMEMTMQPGAPPMVLPVGMVVFMSVAGAAAGIAAFAVLTRFTKHGLRLFQIAGFAFLLLSFAGPLSLPATDGATKATLMLMHVVAGGTIIGLLSRRGGPRQH